MYMYIYMYIYIYVCIYICIYIRININIYSFLRSHDPTLKLIWVYVCLRVCERESQWERKRVSVCAAHFVAGCRVITLQHAATHCNTLQHTATHCNTL